MRIMVLSDLHLEFHMDQGKSFINSLNPAGVDVLVLAGDITTCLTLEKTLKHFCSKFDHVVYVTGNHEFYSSCRENVYAAITRAKSPKLHWLENDIVTIQGQRFLGTTLWFPHDSKAPKNLMNDFHVIRDFEKWVYEANRDAVNFLTKEMQRGDVVVTHHLPSYRSVAERFKGNPLNAFFVCDVEHLIDERSPSIWVHGHTHNSFNYVLEYGKTRILCNPFGYLRHEENKEFDPSKTIDLEVEIYVEP